MQALAPEHSGRSVAEVERRMHDLASTVGVLEHVLVTVAPVTSRRMWLAAVLSQPPVQVPPTCTRHVAHVNARHIVLLVAAHHTHA